MSNLFKGLVVVGLLYFIYTTQFGGTVNLPNGTQVNLPILPTSYIVIQPTTRPINNTNPVNSTLNSGVNKANPTTSISIPTVTAVPQCFIATDAADGHQFCSNGTALDVNDPRRVPGYCTPFQVDGFGNRVCANGMPAGMITNEVPEATQEYINAQQQWPTAAPEQYTAVDQCVTATGPYGQQTVCNPDPKYPWSEGTKSFTAQLIIDGKIKSGTGPKG